MRKSTRPPSDSEPAFTHAMWPGEANGPQLLNEIADFTGGRASAIDDGRRIADVAASPVPRDSRSIRDRLPAPDGLDDGKYHRISVQGTPRFDSTPILTLSPQRLPLTSVTRSSRAASMPGVRRAADGGDTLPTWRKPYLAR